MVLLLILMVLMLLITGQTAADNNNCNISGRVDDEIMAPLKYLSYFWRNLEMPLINCEV